MESPPTSSTWSEAFILSNDSGLLLTSGSASSGDNRNGRKHFLFEDSDCEEKSLSQYDSLDGMSDIICGENFNTLKKGSHWTDITRKYSPIEPPPEFQDSPKYSMLDFFCDKLAAQIIRKAIYEFKEAELKKLRILNHLHLHKLFMPFSPCHIGRPSSRSSLGSSRLSSSHNSLSIPTCHRVDDSTFITQAVSHDTLSSNQISDLYNVPFDSDMYSVPIDVVKPLIKPRRMQLNRKKRRNTASGCKEFETRQYHSSVERNTAIKIEKTNPKLQADAKRHSVAGTSSPKEGEPIHMTLHEVRQYLQTLYSSSSDSSEVPEKTLKPKTAVLLNNNKYPVVSSKLDIQPTLRSKKNTFLINIKNKKVKDSCDHVGKQIDTSPIKKEEKKRKHSPRVFSLKQTLCNMFRFRKFLAPDTAKKGLEVPCNISARALPPLPKKDQESDEMVMDFATSIQRVKDYGWYWGPISSEAAEKILSNEPDGSFIVRDSSDDHYIFSLTFKLNDCVRHVRIDHDQGNFSFGSCTKFKSQTIVEFIENAVEHSRSGRYLFFLHRRPVIGPVRVQLLHPVSRFKQVQSLQHTCRFLIHKHVRRDLIPCLPLPRRMIDYLNTPYYYSEHFIDISEDDTVPSPFAEHQEGVRTVTNRNLDPDVPVNNYLVMRQNDD